MELVWPEDNMGETEWDIAPPFLHVRVHSTKMQKVCKDSPGLRICERTLNAAAIFEPLVMNGPKDVLSTTMHSPKTNPIVSTEMVRFEKYGSNSLLEGLDLPQTRVWD